MATQHRGQQLTPGARAVLDAAGRMFYERGLSAVAMEAIAEEAGVTKKTVYDRFRSKSALVCVYLAERDERYRSWVDNWLADHPDTDPALGVFDALDAWMNTQGSLGCAFVHAHAELLAEPEHPAHQVIREHKHWLHEKFHALVRRTHSSEPSLLATQLLALHEGAIVLGSTSDVPDAISAARQAAERLLHAPA